MQRLMTGNWWLGAVGAILFTFAACATGQEAEKAAAKPAADKPTTEKEAETPAESKPGEKAPDGLVRLSKKHDVWLDTKRKAVVVDGKVCLREGQLEMFACPKGTKEHESIIALNCLPEEVHAGLLALGAKPGTPVRFDPEYRPATGEIVDIFVLWKEPDGTKKEVRAQEMVKHAKTGKAMAYDWIFAGSGFYKDEQTGRLHYQANGGDFICVSNFPSATLDLPVASTDANGGLLFTAFTENIPAKGTDVRVVLVPRLKKAEAKSTEKTDTPSK